MTATANEYQNNNNQMAAEEKATSHSISTAAQEAVQSYKNKIATGKSLQQIEAGSRRRHAMNHARA